MPVESISVTGLFGSRDVKVQLRNNHIVLIGANGLGKTTLINSIFYFLCRRWDKLFNLPLNSISIVYDGISLSARREDYERFNDLSTLVDHKILSRLPNILRRRILLDPNILFSTLNAIDNPKSLESQSLRYEIKSQDLYGIFKDIENDLVDKNRLFATDHYLKQNQPSILFFPTYRKIEKNLKTLFISDDERGIGRIEERLKEALRQDSLPGGCHEFVEFGMDEIVKKIETNAEFLKNMVISEFSNVATEYVKEMLQSKSLSGYIRTIKNVEDTTISRMIERLENTRFSKNETENIKNIVLKIKQDSSPGGPENKKVYTALFISKMLEMEEKIAPVENQFRRFSTLCNAYLSRKKIVFNPKDYTLKIFLPDEKPIDFNLLSSGEKQIITLFSYLVFSENKNKKIVLIDEPELSLSVLWQERLLVDLSGLADSLIAATHSPFIFSDPLIKNYTFDLYSGITNE